MAVKEAAKPAPTKDRIDLRLYNTIVIFDVYTVARTPEAAREAILKMITAGDIEPTETVVKEVTMANSIRSSWAEQAPYVASDVSDDEFEALRGITTANAFTRFYTRRG